MQFTDDIRIYDFEFNLIQQTNTYNSASWSLKYNDAGTFEGHFPISVDIVPLIMGNDYLVIAQGENAAIITGRQAGTDFAVFGRTCSWILSRRVTPDFDQLTGTAETLTRGFVQTAFADVENFVLGPEFGLTKELKFWRNTYNPTLDVVTDCLAEDGAGHRVVFDTKNKQWVYQVYKGQELPLIISEANKNAYDTEITDDCLDFYTGGWYEQKSETQEGETDGGSTWIYIPGVSEKTGIYRWECTLSGSNESEAKSSLRTKRRKNETAVKSRDLILGRDYGLGDIVRVQIQKGQYQTTVKKRITGVNIRYEQGGTGQQPVFSDLEG